jgi:hypothetical protein
LLASAAFMGLEVRNSHQSISYEAMRAIQLPPAWSAGPAVNPLPVGPGSTQMRLAAVTKHARLGR